MAERRTKQGVVNMTSGGHDYYRLRKTIGHKIVDGERVPIRKTFLGRNKSEAEAKYEAWRLEGQSSDSDETFGSLAEYYTINVLPNEKRYAEGTVVLYRGAYQLYVRRMKSLLSTNISEVTLKTLQNEILSLGNEAQSVPKNVVKWMKAFYRWASAGGYCDNIAKALTAPSNRREEANEIEIWDDHSIEILLDFMQEEHHRLRFFVILALHTGLRVGELLALTYSDIENGVITINKQLQRGKILPPKSQDSYRTVPMSPSLQVEFQTYRDLHQKEMKRYGYSSDLIFPTKTGNTMTYSIIRRSLERTYDRILKIDDGFRPHNIHAFRSTFATKLAQSGVRLEVARKLLGHSSIEVTAKYYTAITEQDLRDAVTKLA